MFCDALVHLLAALPTFGLSVLRMKIHVGEPAIAGLRSMRVEDGGRHVAGRHEIVVLLSLKSPEQLPEVQTAAGVLEDSERSFEPFPRVSNSLTAVVKAGLSIASVAAVVA